MAITITQQPQTFTPSDNPIIFTFKQDQYVSGSPKYKVSFVIEVYAGGLIGTFEIFPEVNEALYYYGKIDVSEKVRAFISNHSVSQTLNNTYKGWYDPSNYLEVYIKVFEKYTLVANDEPALYTGSSVSSNIIYVFKASLNRKDFKNWDYTNYQLGSAFPYFLTDESASVELAFPTYSNVFQKTDTKILSWLDDYSVDYKVVVLYLTTGGIVTESTTIPSSEIGVIGAFRFNLLERLNEGWITQSTYDTCYSVFIYIQNNSTSTTISPLYIVNFEDICFDKGANILWLNKYGSYDNYRFTYNSRISAKIESKSFSKRQGEWVNTTYNVNNNTFGKIDYLKTITKQLELSSDWLDETTQNWLVQLYESPLIYLSEGTEVENVVITNSAYQLKQLEHDELFNEIVNIEFTDYKSISL